MASPQSFWNGMIAFVVGGLFTLILLMGIAMPAEKLVAEFESLNVVDATTIYDLSGGWSGSYNDTVFWMNIIYIVSIAPVILGLIIWILSAIKTQDYDVLAPDESGMATGITPEELAYYQQQGLR